ncbi:DUF1917-domain-containing protein [Delitschia confertaspora ATCC 74209]|uniref:DUF1917-domain-containing protein n=1 Tax=Delitschia confertaspora ATCC 74209 TaxID=1513339 RepID=A0A9P4JKL2_9PLEO|nr:DUF1917-domain-containing protein [Delitschia confertaspora ATCC 74209]
MLRERELVSGNGWISDDSSFYGDEDEQDRLLLLCEEFNPKPYWKARSKDLNVVMAMARSAPLVDLHNPLEGMPEARQLNESISEFLQRLPPTSSTLDAVGPWIWIANPYREGQVKSTREHAGDLVERGSELLQRSCKKRRAIETANAGKAATMTKRLLNEESESLKENITGLAEETNVLCGKWMLFPTSEDLHWTWRVIAEAIIDNRLGPTAKIATNGGKPGSRLICVYTKDFRDTDDVLRVLKELVSMGLVDTASQGIYYKSDAYTYLDIYGHNASEVGLQASMYSSQKMLATVSSRTGKEPQKKQTTLDAFRQK